MEPWGDTKRAHKDVDVCHLGLHFSQCAFNSFKPQGQLVTSGALPIYLLPGMTAGYPVYSKLLPLLPNARVVEFPDPAPGESLLEYAKRLAPMFAGPCFIGGVSFGGILAFEISRIVQPAGCILISSIQHPSELPPWLRAWRIIGGRNSSGILKLIGESAKLVPKSIRTSSTLRLSKLSGSEGTWHRWATSAVLDWSPSKPSEPFAYPILRLHGDADTTFPVRYINPDVVIPGGAHTLPVSHPVETANAIADFIGAV